MKIGICEQPEISKKVLPLIDFIEIKTINLEKIKNFLKYKKPFLFHFSYYDLNTSGIKPSFIADNNLVSGLNQKEVKKFINNLPFPWISFHLGLPVKNYAIDDNGDYIALTPPMAENKFLNKVSLNIKKIKKLFPEKKILLEILPFLPHMLSMGAYDYICQPDFINKVLNNNEGYFLLDVGHIIVSAYNLGFKTPQDYLAQLPLEKTIEIHFHRPRFSKKKGIWLDTHWPISGSEIKILKFILKRAKNVQAITLEAQGKHPDRVMIQELKTLKLFC